LSEAAVATSTLVEAIDRVLPQTQCTRCGYPDCHSYAQAIANGEAKINQCPPGGAEGVVRLAAVTGRPVIALNDECGSEGPLTLAVIDEDWCIGCTLCIKACPVDCIVGAPKAMHVVVASQCTGCELCIPACPVDCISMRPVSGAATGWAAWSAAQADEARERYQWRSVRLARDKRENDERLRLEAEAKLANLPAVSHISDPLQLDRKRQMIEAALARARAQRKT
jgi:electron transport complex protein RnfB